jgi:hypothetical protein
MPDETSPYREQIIKWCLRSRGWPPLDQLSAEQKRLVEIFADSYEQIAKEQGVPLELFTWDLENREAWIPLFMFVLP